MAMREVILLVLLVAMVFYCSAWAVTILYGDEGVNFRRAMVIVLKRIGVALVLILIAFEGYLIGVVASLSSLKPYTVGHKRADEKRKQEEAALLKKQRRGAL